ncbi:AI-2E family transporter [Natronococcus sp. JC468]|uniref:AI-2E family transporter n=1 Tax=Natronococcus sp. JC468 TaxID=1961921 RepID=UPI00143B29F1|nr:AI-2E family transporter [Natronococcus sp. JC468]NKE34868.1 AI-2E family transporter [Natronococcus sp. JC468]
MDVKTTFFALLLLSLAAVTTLILAPLLQYVLGAALLAFVLYPAHERLERRIGGRPSALVLTVVAVVAAVIPILYLSVVTVQTVFSFLNRFDETAAVETASEWAIQLGIDPELIATTRARLLAEVNGAFDGAVDVALGEVVGLLDAGVRMGLGLLVLVFLLYYLLADGRTFVRWLAAVAPLEDEVRDELFAEVDVVTWAVIKSHVLVAVVEGLLGGIGFYLLGVPNAPFWTIVMVVVSFLPAIGVWLVWGPAVAYLLMTTGPLPAVALLLYGLSVLSVVDNYLRAIFVDRRTGLHPAVVLIGVVGGIYLLGIMGLFLGPVLLAVFKAGLNVFNETALTTDDLRLEGAGTELANAEPGTADD